MEIALLTDVGQKRTNNQDYVNHFVNRAGRTMIILADGMGGHRAGNIASEMAVTDLGVAWVDTQIDTVNEVREWFAEHIEDAKANPGKHPNIDLLFKVINENLNLTLIPLC